MSEIQFSKNQEEHPVILMQMGGQWFVEGITSAVKVTKYFVSCLSLP